MNAIDKLLGRRNLDRNRGIQLNSLSEALQKINADIKPIENSPTAQLKIPANSFAV